MKDCEAEVRRLKNEIETLKKELQDVRAERDRLESENDQLLAHAETLTIKFLGSNASDIVNTNRIILQRNEANKKVRILEHLLDAFQQYSSNALEAEKTVVKELEEVHTEIIELQEKYGANTSLIALMLALEETERAGVQRHNDFVNSLVGLSDREINMIDDAYEFVNSGTIMYQQAGRTRAIRDLMNYIASFIRNPRYILGEILQQCEIAGTVDVSLIESLPGEFRQEIFGRGVKPVTLQKAFIEGYLFSVSGEKSESEYAEKNNLSPRSVERQVGYYNKLKENAVIRPTSEGE